MLETADTPGMWDAGRQLVLDIVFAATRLVFATWRRPLLHKQVAIIAGSDRGCCRAC